MFGVGLEGPSAFQVPSEKVLGSLGSIATSGHMLHSDEARHIGDVDGLFLPKGRRLSCYTVHSTILHVFVGVCFREALGRDAQFE